MRVGIDARWISARLSGIGVYTLSLVGHLAAIDQENDYILFFDDERIRERTLAQPELRRAANFRSCLVPYRVYSVASQALLPSVLRRHSLEVFHSTNYMIPFLAFPRDRRGRTKCVATIHDVVPLALPDSSPKSRKSRLRLLHRRLMREVGMRAHVMVVDSQASRNDVMKHLRIPHERTDAIRVVYCGVSSTFKPAPMKAENARARSPERIILYVGRSDPYKGILDLVEAFARLRRLLGTTIRLRVVGEMDERYPEAPRRANELGLTDSVEWTGYVAEDELVAAYREASVLVLPSRLEGFGLPVAEAMACGVPVVCSNRGSLPEVAGDAARYVEPGDVDGLTSELRRVLSDDVLRATMVEKGLAQVRQFSWQRAAEQTLAIYQALSDEA